MGLPLTVALNIIECSKNIQKESVLCLGEQTVKFSIRDLINSKKTYNHNVDLHKFKDLDSTKLFTQELFFKTLGYNRVDTLDVSDYEGANILFDLNQNQTPNEHINKYDLIFDGGTLEHVFNIGNALKHLTKMVTKKGIIFHSNPCNGYVDHGFFQISPNLYFDYYLTNEFKIIYSGIIEQSIGIKVYPIRQDLYRTLDPNFGSKNTPRGVLNFCAQNINDINEIAIPQQGFYMSSWNDSQQGRYIVEKHVKIQKYAFLQNIFSLWMKVPYVIIRRLMSIKK